MPSQSASTERERGQRQPAIAADVAALAVDDALLDCQSKILVSVRGQADELLTVVYRE
jgi:hypothetical protein